MAAENRSTDTENLLGCTNPPDPAQNYSASGLRTFTYVTSKWSTIPRLCARCVTEPINTLCLDGHPRTKVAGKSPALRCSAHTATRRLAATRTESPKGDN